MRRATVLAAGLLLAAGSARAQMDHAAHAPAPRVDVGTLRPAEPDALAASMAHHEQRYGAVLVDKLEWRGGGGSDIGAWEAQASYGGDYEKVWVNTRGEYDGHARSLARAELQLLYSHLVGYFFDAQAGVRQDFPIRPDRSSPARTHPAPGPAAADRARPRGQRRPARPLGAGVTRLETGLRLRYEVTREFAPYVGIQYESVLGDTARFYRWAGEDSDSLGAIAGIRLFF